MLEAIRGKTRVREVHTEKHREHADIKSAAEAQRVRVTERSRDELDRLCEGVRHQGVIALADDYAYADLEDLIATSGRAPLLVALDEITDPQNLGAIVRSAVTLGVDGVIIQKHRAAGITPAVVRASAGATEHASISRVTNLQKALLSLSESGLEIVGLDAGSHASVRDLAPASSGRVLVVGSEGKGLRRMVRQRCHIVVQIPQEGPMDSLNASVAAAIAMHEMVGKRQGHANDG